MYSNPLNPPILINAYTDSVTLGLVDANRLATLEHASAKTWTVPPNADVAFPIGTPILGASLGAGTVTITAGSGVTLRAKGGLLASAAQYAQWSIIKIATNTWLVSGQLA